MLTQKERFVFVRSSLPRERFYLRTLSGGFLRPEHTSCEADMVEITLRAAMAARGYHFPEIVRGPDGSYSALGESAHGAPVIVAEVFRG
jgi:hypothetical protein